MGKSLVIQGADFSKVSVGRVDFVLGKISLSVIANENEFGNVTGAGSYTEGSVVEIKAIPNNGYAFSRWQDGNTENPRMVTIGSEPMTFVAEFAENSYTDISDLSVQGFVSPMGDNGKWYKGDNPSTESKFVTATKDGNLAFFNSTDDIKITIPSAYQYRILGCESQDGKDLTNFVRTDPVENGGTSFTTSDILARLHAISSVNIQLITIVITSSAAFSPAQAIERGFKVEIK